VEKRRLGQEGRVHLVQSLLKKRQKEKKGEGKGRKRREERIGAAM